MTQNLNEERIDGLAPFQALAESINAGVGEFVDQVSALIDKAQAFAAAQVNATLTLRDWYIGRLIDAEVLKEGRAGYDQEIVATLSPQLTKRLGRGFNKPSLYRMIKFAQTFPDSKTVATLARQLSWSQLQRDRCAPER